MRLRAALARLVLAAAGLLLASRSPAAAAPIVHPSLKASLPGAHIRPPGWMAELLCLLQLMPLALPLPTLGALPPFFPAGRLGEWRQPQVPPGDQPGWGDVLDSPVSLCGSHENGGEMAVGQRRGVGRPAAARLGCPRQRAQPAGGAGERACSPAWSSTSSRGGASAVVVPGAGLQPHPPSPRALPARC